MADAFLMLVSAENHAIPFITAQIEELDVTARQHISVLIDLPRIRIRGRVAKYVFGSWMSLTAAIASKTGPRCGCTARGCWKSLKKQAVN